ncbi:MAG: hypothetical protein ACTSR9_14400 [Candidatus Thorarchaeota archaeon]
MWRIVRPDSRRVWQDPEVVRRLSRYRAIIDKERLAKYLIAKKFAFDGDLSESTQELWRLHKECSTGFGELVSKIDEDEVDFSELPNPPQSFLDLKIILAHRILSDCHFCERNFVNGNAELIEPRMRKGGAS